MVKPASKKSRSRRGWLIALAAVLVLIAAGAVYALPMLTKRAPSRAIIVVPDSADMDQLADTLTSRFGKDYSDATMRAARLMGSAFRLRPGAWEIKSGERAFSAARIIGRGRQYIVNLPLNNIRTADELAARVASRMRMTADELLDRLDDPATLAPYGLTPADAMALFIADNYELYWVTSPEDFIGKIGERYRRFWTPERVRKASALGLTPAQAATLASIVDEETNKADEKGRVGRLYLNRLAKGMRLQADPTVKFAVGDFGIKRVTKTHLDVASPYNTYRNAGLPPGPIRITDPRTVDAILDSQPTDEIYMCARADLSGYHDFTSSYDEHLSNARRYQEKLNEMQIK